MPSFISPSPMKRLKILHIQVLPKLSGVQKVSLEVLKSLSSNQYDKYILFSDALDCGDKAECFKAFEACGVKVLTSRHLHRSIGPKDLPALIEIYRLCRRERFDIVHTNSTKPGIIGRIAAYMARVPLVVHTVHGLSFHQFVPFPRWQFYWACEMFASMFCDRITIVNQFYTKYFRWFRRKTCTIYNGIDFGHLPAISAPQGGTKGDTLNVLFVGRLDQPKNPMMLLKVAKQVLTTKPHVHFWLVGDGEFMDQCRQYVHDNRLAANVHLEGWRTDVTHYYAQADIFAATSLYEAFGIMFLEAGFYNLPVCATNVEGIPEVVANGETGLLSSPDDVNSFAANLLRLIEDGELRHTMGHRGHERVVSRFNSEQMVSSYEAIYREGLGLSAER